MSTTGARPSVVLLILAAAAAGVALATRTNPDGHGFDLSYTLGAAAALFLAPGIIPIVWWGIRRFRTQHASGPLMLWALLQFLISGVQFLELPEDIAASAPVEFQPAGCEFSVQFPTEPRRYDLQKADATGRLFPLSGAELELPDGRGLIRAECTVFDALDPAQLNTAFLTAASRQIGADLGLERIAVEVEDGPCGLAATVIGVKNSEMGMLHVEVTNYHRARSNMTLYFASFAKDWRPHEAGAFADSLRCS